jgi:hypothetical protein
MKRRRSGFLRMLLGCVKDLFLLVFVQFGRTTRTRIISQIDIRVGALNPFLHCPLIHHHLLSDGLIGHADGVEGGDGIALVCGKVSVNWIRPSWFEHLNWIAVTRWTLHRLNGRRRLCVALVFVAEMVVPVAMVRHQARAAFVCAFHLPEHPRAPKQIQRKEEVSDGQQESNHFPLGKCGQHIPCHDQSGSGELRRCWRMTKRRRTDAKWKKSQT